MTNSFEGAGILRHLTWEDAALIAGILVLARVLVLAARWAIGRSAERGPARLRLAILRFAPLLRLLIEVGSVVLIVPLLIEPTFENTLALLAAVSLGLAFALKDYGSSLIAGLVTLLERPYQPGDWVEIGGIYGEVKSIGVRAVHLITADDTEVIVPHARLWTASIANASSGKRSLLCVAEFFLHPEHDGEAVRQRLIEVAESSPHRLATSPVKATASEEPWGTRYRLKAYVRDSREQFAHVTDLTLRGKAALTAMGIHPAQAPYAKTGGH
jgi:small-conductance mechanosensitive channel